MSSTAAVVLAAGQGTRMRSDLPKVLHPLAGAPLLAYVLDLCVEARLEPVCAVVGYASDQVRATFADREGLLWADQPEQRGTADAVRCGLPALPPETERVVVLSGDVPLLRAETLRELTARHEAEGGGVSFLSARLDDPTGYGRVVREGSPGGDGPVRAIVEHKDATDEQRAIREINAGVYLVDLAVAQRLLPRIDADNAQGEMYLTDIVALALAEGTPVRAMVVDDPDEIAGVNAPEQLARLAGVAQRRIQATHMANGVTITAPDLTWIEKGATIGEGALIHPFSLIRAGVIVGAGCEVGPHAHLREGAVLDDGAAVGNFVEVKKSRLGKKTKAKHLTYIGNAELGDRCNVGAGTVFCNYDGEHKHTTTVGEGTFIGSGSMLVAPLSIGAGAKTGAGAVVTRDVADGEVVVGVPARPLGRRDDSGSDASDRSASGAGEEGPCTRT